MIAQFDPLPAIHGQYQAGGFQPQTVRFGAPLACEFGTRLRLNGQGGANQAQQ